MRSKLISSLFAAATLSAVCLAQDAVQSQAGASASQQTSATASPSGAQVASHSQLQAGSTVQAELTKPVDARKNKVGDEVLAKTTHDVKADGHVVIPKGSKLIGHVTEVQAHSKEQAVSSVGLAFDHAILKNGTEMPLALGIQAIGRSQASAAAADDAMSGDVSAMGSSSAQASSPGGGGMLGGVRSTAGTAVNTAGSVAGSATNTAGSLSAGASGSLTATSRGVVGLPGLSLSADTSTSAQASVISSNGSNVHLDSGTEMILRVNQ